MFYLLVFISQARSGKWKHVGKNSSFIMLEMQFTCVVIQLDQMESNFTLRRNQNIHLRDNTPHRGLYRSYYDTHIGDTLYENLENTWK